MKYRYNSKIYYKLVPLLYESKENLDDRINKIKNIYVRDELNLDEYEDCLDEIMNPNHNRMFDIYSDQ